jgi:hypothetical protein
MKSLNLILFMLMFNSPVAKAQKTGVYKYVYQFQLIKPNEKSSIAVDTFTKESNLSTISGKVINYQSQPLYLFSVILKSRDTAVYSTTNEKGLFEINVKPATYELSISGVGYASMTQTLAINKNINFKLTIKAARRPGFTLYDIHSTRKLKKAAIDQIKACVDANDGKSHQCGKKNEYYITIEI